MNILNVITQKIDWLGVKSQLHTQNIAQLDIPSYQGSEMRPFKDVMVRKGELNLRPQDIQVGGSEMSKESEVVAIAETAAHHQAMVGTYKKYMTLIKILIGNHA